MGAGEVSATGAVAQPRSINASKGQRGITRSHYTARPGRLGTHLAS